MAGRFEVWLDGAGLQDIDKSLHILDVIENALAFKTQTIDNGKYDGLRLVGRKRTQRTVQIKFVLLQRDALRRRAILDDVLRWTHDGKLTTSARNGQYLEVVYTELPCISRTKNWANEMTVTFTAYDPYWKNEIPQTAMAKTQAGIKTTAFLSPAGTAENTYLEFDLQNTSTAVLNSASVTVNGRAFAFEVLGLNAGHTLKCSYENGFLSIRAGTERAMDKRVPTSADDLVVYLRRENKVEVTTDTEAKILLYARGQWL